MASRRDARRAVRAPLLLRTQRHARHLRPARGPGAQPEPAVGDRWPRRRARPHAVARLVAAPGAPGDRARAPRARGRGLGARDAQRRARALHLRRLPRPAQPARDGDGLPGRDRGRRARRADGPRAQRHGAHPRRRRAHGPPAQGAARAVARGPRRPRAADRCPSPSWCARRARSSRAACASAAWRSRSPRACRPCAATGRGSSRCCRTCSTTPPSSWATRPQPRIEVGARPGPRRAGLLRARQRPRHRAALPREGVRPLRPPRSAGRGHRHRPRAREAHRRDARRRVWVESEGPGRGSTFCFTLPAQRRAPCDQGSGTRTA